MRTTRILSLGLAVGIMVWSGIALAQSPPGKCGSTPEKLQGQIVKIDAEQGKVTIRGTDGVTHELQASKETLEGYKIGDHLQAKLRTSPDCK